MTDHSKKGAYDKINYITRNVAWPDFVLDWSKLDALYKDVVFKPDPSYNDIIQVLTKFRARNSYQPLTKTATETSARDDFHRSPCKLQIV